MSSTNKTTNYKLSQYIGTDMPTYLGDYNSDMLKIDTQMKANNTLGNTANGKANTNALAIGNLSNLNTTVKTNLVGAINEVNEKASQTKNIVGGVAYDNTETYAVGDFCIYENTLYRCTTAIAVAEEWNSSHWIATSVEEELEVLRKVENYSTTETKIGTWIDGKPLYRTVFTTTFSGFTANNYVSIYTPLSDKIITNIQGIVQRQGYEFYNPLGSDFGIAILRENNNIRFYDVNSNLFSNGDILIATLEYTKTTD